MTWRRIAPWVIGLIALLAIFISLPRQTLGLDWLPREVAGIEFRTILGLDLQGGLRVTLEVSPQEGQEITEEEVEVARDIIERRVAGIGVTEPQVRTEVGGDGSRRIVVEVPGVSDQDQVRDLVGSTGQLEFVDPMGQQLTADQDIAELVENGSVRVLFDGGEIQQGSVAPDVGQGNQIGVSFALSDEGSRIWCDFTTANVGRPGPIALDRQVITTPTINSPICGGTTIITVGPPTEANELERTNLYNTLRFGALPVALEEQGVESVAPTLGADFLTQALVAGGVGLVLVLLFMVLYWQGTTVVRGFALVLIIGVLVSMFSAITVTRTMLRYVVRTSWGRRLGLYHVER